MKYRDQEHLNSLSPTTLQSTASTPYSPRTPISPPMNMSIPETFPLSIPILNLTMTEINGKRKPVTVDTITD